MIRTKLAYDGTELYINPYTISYLIRRDDELVIAFTNGHQYNITASVPELLEVIKNETKCSCTGYSDEIL